MSGDFLNSRINQILFVRACLASNESKFEDMHTFLELMTPTAMLEAAVQTVIDMAVANSASHEEIRTKLVAVGTRMEDTRLRLDPTWAGSGFSPQQQSNLDLAAALGNVNVFEGGLIALSVQAKDRVTLGCSLVYAASILAVNIANSGYVNQFTFLLDQYLTEVSA